MKELEDTKTEVRRVIDLRSSIWDRLNSFAEDDGGSTARLPGCDSCSIPQGDFFKDASYAWLSNGPRLVVLSVKTGMCISSWTFSDRITSVAPFPAQPGQVPLLLVGLDNGANKIRDSAGMVCVFDCSSSRVLRAVRMPAGVERVCVVIGGAEWEDFGDKRMEHFFVENSGLACVALRNLDHLMIDLRRSSWEGPDATPVADESSPAELDFSARHKSTSMHHSRSSREKHVAYNLMNSRVEQYIGFNREEFESTTLYQESMTSSMICSRKIGCLVSGCLGRIIIWQMDGAVRWVSPPVNDTMRISNLALLEPTDDPRPYCYLWASYQEETLRLPPVLRMYAVLFEQKYSDKGSNTYLNLEGEPRLKFELELDEGNRITNLYPIVRESNPEQTESGNKRGEENLLLISSDSRTLLFDLNQWYKEQMPHTVGDCQNPNAFLASYRTRSGVRSTGDETIVNCCHLPSTLKEFRNHGSSPPEELFFPNSLALEWVDLGTGRLTFWMTRGVQVELLREMSLAGPAILLEPSETFHRCLSAGLISSGTETSFGSNKDAQRGALLSLCLEQRWLHFLLQCTREWSDGSASYLLHDFVRWGMQRATTIKLTAHRLCEPLFDNCSISIGEAEVRTLHFYSQQIDCISNVFAKSSIDSIELTMQRRALHRISTYLQVLLWFCNVGLLPETQDIDDEAAPLSFSLRIPYPFERLATIYAEKRDQFNARTSKNIRDTNEENFFIDELLTRECPALKLQWEREGSELSFGGNYPPPSLQSLLRSYLTDCHNEDSNEMENKHQITMYLLMDLAMLLQESYPGVDQLIKHPSAFKLSPSLIKLTQALWLLDHEDYPGFLNMMTGQLVSDSDVRDWHHKLVMRTLIRNNKNKFALTYLRVRKPPLSSLEDQGIVMSLSVEHGLVQSAFHRTRPSHYNQLLTRFFRACKLYGRLNDILHLSLDPEEEEAFVKFLEDEKSDDTRLLYYLQRCRYAEAGGVYPAGVPSARGNFHKSNKPVALTVFNAYNATLPSITREFSGKLNRRVLKIDPDSRYPRPMSHCKSRCAARDIHESAIRKAKETFVRGERSQIPFISAPCASLRSRPDNVDTNCVRFVERARKPYGKRRLEEMSGGAEGGTNNDNNSEERKRRKTSNAIDTPDAAEGKEVGMSMVFDTPLIKRKTQIISARNAPSETPQSILKIRQMIRKSRSPSVLGATTMSIGDDKKVFDAESKPRRIRFSEGQRRAEESIDEEEAQSEGKNIVKDIALEEATEDSDETEKSLSKCDMSEDEEDEDAQQAEEESESTFFSTNLSGKSLSETTILSDSSYSIRNVSGPRPRPSLRRSNISSKGSSSDLLRKSLMEATDASTERSWTPTLSDSAKISSDLSSREEKSFGTSSYPQSPRARASLLSTSIYSETILSSDTSFKSTPAPSYEKRHTRWTESPVDGREKSASLAQRTVDQLRDFSGITGALEKNEHLSRSSRSVAVETVTRIITEEYSRDGGEDNNSEVLMEVDGFGLDRDSDTRPPSDRESTCERERIAERRQRFARSMAQSFSIPEVSETEENPGEIFEEGNEEEKDEEKYLGNGWPTRDVLPSKNETVENAEVTETNDGYDDELLALKYDEDDEPEEAFQSLTNSMDVDCSSVKLSNDETKKSLSSNSSFYEAPKLVSHEFTITDDESSRSVEGSVLGGSTNVEPPIELPDEIKSAKKSREEIIPDNVSNMTDDESDLSRDSSIFFSRRRESLKKNVEEKNSRDNKITNDGKENSLDSSIFSVGRRKEVNRESHEENDFRAESDKTATSNKSKESESNESRTESSPLPRKGRQSPRLSKRMTRAHRASSAVQESLASPLPASPAAKSKGEQVGRLRRASSLAKDLLATSENKQSPMAATESKDPVEAVPGKTGRYRRSTSLAKEVFVTKSSPAMESSTHEELPKRPPRRAASMQKEIPASTVIRKVRTRLSLKASLSEETVEQPDVPTAKRTTRGKRGSSVSNESSEPVIEPKRTTRASSLAKEVPEVSEEIPAATTKRVTRKRGSSVPKETPLETSDRVSTQRSKRGRSAAKEIIPEKSSEYPEESEKSSWGWKTNEDGSPTSSTRGRLTSITSIAEEDDEEVFSFASKGSSVSNKNSKPIVGPKRTTRASSLAKEVPEESEEIPVATTKRVPRKRGSSVPKETPLETSDRASTPRSRRGGSAAKEIIPEKSSEYPEESKKSSWGWKTNEDGNLTSSTRSRLTSITSIAEEDDEEIFSIASKGKVARETKKASISRERRAVSVDQPMTEVKRRTRASALKSAISEDPIQEEKETVTRKPPVRRKRTTSGTSVKDFRDVADEKLPTDRTRKMSQTINESTDVFRFSPPDQPQHRPDDYQKGGDEVPDYVFSSPHTRSKDTSNQLRRYRIYDSKH